MPNRLQYSRAYIVLLLAGAVVFIGAYFYTPSSASQSIATVSPVVRAAIKAGVVTTAEKTIASQLTQQQATVTNLAQDGPITVDGLGVIHVPLTVTTIEGGTLHIVVLFAKSGYQIVGVVKAP